MAILQPNSTQQPGRASHFDHLPRRTTAAENRRCFVSRRTTTGTNNEKPSALSLGDGDLVRNLVQRTDLK